MLFKKETLLTIFNLNNIELDLYVPRHFMIMNTLFYKFKLLFEIDFI